MELNNNQKAFLALASAGLWEKSVSLSQYGMTYFEEIYRLAEEQAVVGLVAAGLEKVEDLNIPQDWALQFAGSALHIEQRNYAMNKYVAELIEMLREKGVYALLVKGQGIAQCYARPLWRACGDIDLLLSESNYIQAKKILLPVARVIEKEEPYEQHLGITINNWVVELHGSLRTRVSSRIDKGIDNLQNELFYGGDVRLWLNGGVQVFLPSVNIDVLLVFTHILKHYFIEGVGLRQICDWCRLLWVNRNSIDREYLETHIRKMGIMSEWESFAALAVDRLGMPSEAMPFYSSGNKKAMKILHAMFDSGNMGHNRDVTYQKKYTPIKRKLVTFNVMIKNSFRRFFVFPCNSVNSLWMFTKRGVADLFR